MKLSKLGLAVLVAISLPAFAGDKAGNGGGVIRKDGRWMTFYSAGFYTDPSELSSDEVPQLNALLDFFNTTTVLSLSTKTKIVKSLMPLMGRSYFKVKEETFTPEVRENLIAQYGRKMNVDATQLGLAAITDTESGNTYLLPNFYTLQPNEQKAILFHEAYWMLHRTADYNAVIQAEMSYQSMLTSPTPEHTLRWVNFIGTTADVLASVIATDLASGALNGLAKRDSRIAVTDLFGNDYFDCLTSTGDAQCKLLLNANIYSLTKKFPNSLFLRFILEKLTLEQMRFTYYVREREWQYNGYSYGINPQRFLLDTNLIGSEHFYRVDGHFRGCTEGERGCAAGPHLDPAGAFRRQSLDLKSITYNSWAAIRVGDYSGDYTGDSSWVEFW